MTSQKGGTMPNENQGTGSREGLRGAWAALSRIGSFPATAFAVRASGPPDRPLLEAVLLFAAFYMISFVPADPAAAGQALGETAYYSSLLMVLVPKALFLFYMMARSDGLPAFGVSRIRPADLPKAFAVSVGAFLIVILPSLAAQALGVENPILAEAERPAGPAFPLAALAISSAMAIGYSEELFFRSYLIRRLGQAGLPPLAAAIASSLAFGSAHGIQGVLGLVLATALGGFFAWLWLRDGNIHEIALGHAIYDTAVIGIALYA
jgi:membrane protease YdiL (CAAX protease family)